PGLALTCLVGAMGVGLTAIEDGLLLFEPIRSTVRLAGVLRDELRPGEQILVEGKYEHHAGIGFYTRQRVRIYRGSYGILMHGSRYADSAGTFVSEEEFARLWRGPGRAYLVPTPRIACPGCGSWPRSTPGPRRGLREPHPKTKCARNPQKHMAEIATREIKDTTANPAPLGLLAFGMTTVLLNLHNAGFFELGSMILGMGIFYGGAAQVIAGITEWKKNNTFGTTAFLSYGMFWLTLVALVALPKQIPGI